MNGGRRIRSEELEEHQYIERYVRGLESKRVKWDENSNVEQMWEE